MICVHELSTGHKRLFPLIQYVMSEGWLVMRTPGGHLRLTKAGLPTVFTGPVPVSVRPISDCIEVAATGDSVGGNQDG